MGQRFFQLSGFCVAVGLAFLQSAEAGERRTDGAQKSVVGPAFTAASVFGNHTPVVVGQRIESGSLANRREEPKESTVSRPERKTIKLFRFNTRKLGEVSVQPVVGGVNGAQVSIGF